MKHLALFLILLFSSKAVYCQFSVGIKEGFVVSAMSKVSSNTTGMMYAPYFSSGPILGIHLGGFAQIPIVKKLHLQPELRIIQRGAKKSENTDPIKLIYLELPISILYKANRWLSFEGGPVFSYTLSGKIGKYYFHDNTFEHYTYGAQLGVNYHLTDKIAIGASYYRGLKPALQNKFYNNDNSVLAHDRYYNRSVSLSLRCSLFNKETQR